MDIPFSQEALAQLDQMVMDIPYRLAAPIVNLVNQQIQRAHEMAADRKDMPSGATAAPDNLRGD